MSGQLDYELCDHQFYATPPENVDCLAHFIDLRRHVVWEPACGEGHISKRIARYCGGVFSTDLIDRGYGKAPLDFLEATRLPGNDLHQATAIITNPPYGDEAEKFIRKALELTKPVDGMVAMFMRNEYDMRSTRGADLFEPHPAYRTKICVTKRPRWIEGTKGSPRHNYAWFVWDWSMVSFLQTTGATIRYVHPKNAHPIGAPEVTVQ